MPVGIQTVYNPRTKEVRAIDLTQSNAQRQLAQLYQQGWQSYKTTPQQARALVQAVQPVQRQVTITQAAQPPQSPLTPFINNGQINLVDVAKSGDQQAIDAAKQMYGDQMKVALQANKIPVTTDQYFKLGEGAKDNVRIVLPASLDEWNKALREDDTEFLLKHYPESKSVKAEVASKLAPAVLGKTAYYSPSVWESITPWAEEKGETATTARVLKWEADIVIPFVYVGSNWHRLSNYEKGLNLALDALIIGAVARKPISSILKTATSNIIKNSLGNKSAKLIVNEIKTLNKTSDAVEIKKIGVSIQNIGTAINNKQFINDGRWIAKNADDIANGTIDTANKIKETSKGLRKFLKDQRGSIGKEIAFPIPDDELAKSGLSQDELIEILNKVGDDANLFRAEIINRQRIKAGLFKKIEKVKEEEKKYLTYEDLGLQKAPAPKAKPKVKVMVVDVEESKAVKQAEKILQKTKVKKNVRHAIAVRIEKQIRKQAQIIAKAQKAAAQKVRIQTAIRNALRIATQTALAQAVKNATATQIKTATQTKVKQMVLPATLTKTLTATAIATALKTQTLLKTENLTKTQVKREIVVAPRIDTTTDIIPVPTSPEPEPATPTPTPPGSERPAPRRRKRKPTKDESYEVKDVRGIPEDPGIVSFNAGIVRIKIKPPYRTSDIAYMRLKEPQEGEGSQERTLKVTRGEAPEMIVLQRGFDELKIKSGKSMKHDRVDIQSEGMVVKGGRGKRQKQGSII